MIRRLLILSGLATIGAVINHSTHFVLLSMFWWTDLYRPVTVPNYDVGGSVSYYFLLLTTQIAIVAVPVFLFISGFFISAATGRKQKRIGWSAVFNRIKFLIVPYLIWSCVIILGNFILEGQAYDLRSILWALISGQATPAFYYIPLLIILYLLSPFLSPLAKYHPWLLLLIGFVLLAGTLLARYTFFLNWPTSTLEPYLAFLRNWQLPANFLWFVVGMVFGFHLGPVKKQLTKSRWILLLFLIMTYVLAIVEAEMVRWLLERPWNAPQVTVMSQLFIMFFLLTYIAFENVTFPFSSSLSSIGSKAYGVYLVHIPILIIIAKAIYHLAPNVLQYYILFQTILVVGGVGIPILIMHVVNRSPMSKYYQYMFG